MNEIVTTINGCARCGETHEDMVFQPFEMPCGRFTHWAECPESGAPVLMRVESGGLDDAEPVSKVKIIQESFRADLINACMRYAYYRVNGPAHEVTFALEDLQVSLRGMGLHYENEGPPDAPYTGLPPGQTTSEAADERRRWKIAKLHDVKTPEEIGETHVIQQWRGMCEVEKAVSLLCMAEIYIDDDHSIETLCRTEKASADEASHPILTLVIAKGEHAQPIFKMASDLEAGDASSPCPI